MTQIDLASATSEMARIASNVRDHQLGLQTPCSDYSVAALLDHIVGLSLAFAWAARKQALQSDAPRPGTAQADNLDPAWRELLPARLDELVRAWREPGAFDGETEAGGVTLPAAVMASVALDELVLHGWDLAVSTGQDFRVNPTDALVVLAFTESAKDMPNSIFGPAVPIASDAPSFERALGFAGRDPLWRPTSAATGQDAATPMNSPNA